MSFDDQKTAAFSSVTEVILPIGCTSQFQTTNLELLIPELRQLGTFTALQFALMEASELGADRLVFLLRDDLGDIENYVRGPALSGVLNPDHIRSMVDNASFFLVEGAGSVDQWLHLANPYIEGELAALLIPSVALMRRRAFSTVTLRDLAVAQRKSEGSVFASKQASWEESIHNTSFILERFGNGLSRIIGANSEYTDITRETSDISLGRAIIEKPLLAALPEPDFLGDTLPHMFTLVETALRQDFDVYSHQIPLSRYDLISQQDYARALYQHYYGTDDRNPAEISKETEAVQFKENIFAAQFSSTRDRWAP